MQRVILPTIAAVALLSWVAVVLLWIVSYVRPMELWSRRIRGTPNGVEVTVVYGSLSIQKGTASVTAPVNGGVGLSITSGWDAFGLHFHRLIAIRRDAKRKPIPGIAGQYAEFWFSLFWPFFLTTALTAWIIIALLRRRAAIARSLVGRVCARCGYDLRASRGRCPECGTVIPTHPKGRTGRSRRLLMGDIEHER